MRTIRRFSETSLECEYNNGVLGCDIRVAALAQSRLGNTLKISLKRISTTHIIMSKGGRKKDTNAEL